MAYTIFWSRFRRPHAGTGGGKISVGKHDRLAPPPAPEQSVLQKNVPWQPAESTSMSEGQKVAALQGI